MSTAAPYLGQCNNISGAFLLFNKNITLYQRVATYSVYSWEFISLDKPKSIILTSQPSTRMFSGFRSLF